MQIVINLVGEPAHGLLAESRFVDRVFLPGGEHNMYELAFAAAALGLDVELRGWLDRAAFDELARETGLAPRVDLPARKPEADDLVVVPEGWRDPLDYARLLLSPAQLALFLLAPPGLFGWPFCEPGWTCPDPLTVRLDAVGRPEHFRAIDALGISLLTHSPGLVAAAEEAGVSCAFVGTGRPKPPEPAPEAVRTVDVIALTANRWEPLVCAVVDELDDLSIDLVGESPNEEVLRRLSRARVLLWPSRVEGHATVPWEARSVGCVPVALSTNRFAVGLSEATGTVIVDAVEQLAPAIRRLLADPVRCQELSARAMRTAPAEVEWEPYVDRVRQFLQSTPPSGPGRQALAGMGSALQAWLDARSAEAQASLEALHSEEQRLRAHRDALALRLEQLHAKRAVRLAVRLESLRRRGDS